MSLGRVAVEIYLEEVLGVGSYGKVCKAKCGQLPCAAKLLHDTMFLPFDPGNRNVFLEKFERECQFLSSIKHPNIVQCLASVRVSQSNMPALLMELMDESLTKFLERSPGAISYHIQVGICHDIALALAYLHGNAIIHRDLSSNNVLVIGAGVRAKVTDFGMSRVIDTNPQLSSVSLTQCPGTLAYMPPEALTAAPQYSDRLDCFSHGVLTVQIVTGNFPSPGDAHKRIEDSSFLNQQLFCQVPEVERRIADINLMGSSHPLFPIVLDCLKDSSSDRPSADELCIQLSSLKGSQQYKLSLEQAKIGTVGDQAQHEMEKKYFLQIQELETKNRIVAEYEAKLLSLESELSVRETRRTEKRELELKLEARESELSIRKTMLEESQTEKRTLELKLEASNAEIQKLKKELEEKSQVPERVAAIQKPITLTAAPNYKIQKEKVEPILERTKEKKGDTWYIVDRSWLEAWKEYVGYLYESQAGHDYAHPGPMETSTLLKGNRGEELKDGLRSRNYSLLPAAAWELLVSWYGLSEGSRPIQRKVVYYNLYSSYQVEVYFLEFNFCTHSNQTHMIAERISRGTTVGQLEQRMREIFSIPQELNCRLWHRDSLYKFVYKLVTCDPSWIVQDAGFEKREDVLLEVRNRDGTWPARELL